MLTIEAQIYVNGLFFKTTIALRVTQMHRVIW